MGFRNKMAKLNGYENETDGSLPLIYHQQIGGDKLAYRLQNLSITLLIYSKDDEYLSSLV